MYPGQGWEITEHNKLGMYGNSRILRRALLQAASMISRLCNKAAAEAGTIFGRMLEKLAAAAMKPASRIRLRNVGGAGRFNDMGRV